MGDISKRGGRHTLARQKKIYKKTITVSFDRTCQNTLHPDTEKGKEMLEDLLVL
jgi:hypothetical protein